MRSALSFLTAVGGARTPTPGALAWFGPVGAAMGLLLGGVWWGAGRLWPAAVAAAVVVAADLAATGLLHLDGLVDAADGLLPHLDRDRRLTVMQQPDAGAFGVGVAGGVLLLRWAALASVRPAPLLLAALWCLSRAAMAATAAVVPYARADGGLATAFGAGGARLPHARRGALARLVATVAAAAGLAALWRVPAGPVAVAVSAGAFAAVVALARRRLGGFTGDILGAAGMVAESAGLLVAAARW